MQYTGYSLTQAVSLDAIVAGLTGATGVEGVILSNHADFTTKNSTATTKNTTQDNTLSSLETKATGLEAGATGLEARNATLSSDFVTLQSREDALLAGLTGPSGLEARAVGFNNNIIDINANLDGNIQNQINTKVADSIFQALKTEFETDFEAFQNQLNQKVVTATQEVIDARQDTDDAVLEKKFCSIEEFAQTFLQTYTVKKADGNNYNFDGKIQNNDKAPPIFSIIEKKQSTTVSSDWDLKLKLTDYGYNVMSGNIVVKNGADTVVNTLMKADFDATTKLYSLTLANSNSSGTLINGPYTFEYRASTNTAVYSLTLDSTVLSSIGNAPTIDSLDVLGNPVWGRWIGGAGAEYGNSVSATSDSIYVIGTANGSLMSVSGLSSEVLSDMGTKLGSTTNNDALIVKYNVSGTALWARWIGGDAADAGYSVSATSDSIYVIGTANGSLMSVSGLSSEVLSDMGTKPGSTANNDVFIVKYNVSGTALWARWIGGTGVDIGRGISASSDGVYVTGYATETPSVVPGLPFDVINNMGTKPGSISNNDAFIIKYNNSGDAQWARWIGGTGTDWGMGISSSLDGVYVTGLASGVFVNTTGLTSQVINDMGTKPGSISNNDAFIIKYNNSGDAQWARWIGGTGSDQGTSISVTSDAVYVTGYASGVFVNTTGLTSQVIDDMGTKPGSEDAFIIKYNNSGDAQWARWIGGTGNERGMGISASSDAVYVTGNTNENISGLTPEILTSMGAKPGGATNLDVFLVKYV